MNPSDPDLALTFTGVFEEDEATGTWSCLSMFHDRSKYFRTYILHTARDTSHSRLFEDLSEDFSKRSG